MSSRPIGFTFGLHVHQPVGNFDDVFQEHVDRVYLPFLQKLKERSLFPFSLHLSGPLLEWMDANDRRVLDLVGSLASDGHVELLCSGLYEPVLAALSSSDRIEQVEWMRATLHGLFGVDATGLWLTERVWEPDLTADLAKAGMRFAIVDDHHFLVSGFERDRLHRPFWSEHDGRRLALFPIDERLRYLVPFRPPDELAEYLRRLRRDGHRLAILADDGEKFGGWPGTADWLYQQGWLASFLDMMDELRTAGEVAMTTFADALDTVPAGGPAYLPTASYREMESWALPTEAAVRLQNLTGELGTRAEGPDGALLRGSHWKNFLVKYREARRMHQKATALSSLARRMGDPPDARRAIGRAQCNDAYWHGVFGGLYLKHLRDAVWDNLALAEGVLRRHEKLRIEPRDFDADGHPELWIHSHAFSALVTPALGGAVEEYTVFRHRLNFANALTRRREPYHFPPPAEPEAHETASVEGTPSIHQLEAGFVAEELPPVDDHVRALLIESIVAPADEVDAQEPATVSPAAVVRSWAHEPLKLNLCRVEGDVAHIRLVSDDGALEKSLRFEEDGSLDVEYRWSAPEDAGGRQFAVELSFGSLPRVEPEPMPAVETVEPIRTVSRTEEGLAEGDQGLCLTYRWSATLGRASIRIRPEPV